MSQLLHTSKELWLIFFDVILHANVAYCNIMYHVCNYSQMAKNTCMYKDCPQKLQPVLISRERIVRH